MTKKLQNAKQLEALVSSFYLMVSLPVAECGYRWLKTLRPCIKQMFFCCWMFAEVKQLGSQIYLTNFAESFVTITTDPVFQIWDIFPVFFIFFAVLAPTHFENEKFRISAYLININNFLNTNAISQCKVNYQPVSKKRLGSFWKQHR